MTKIVVLGAGPMGLAAAYQAVSLGHEVDLVEADSKVGGMAAHFDFDGLSIERFYHFICKSDASTFAASPTNAASSSNARPKKSAGTCRKKTVSSKDV